MNETKTNDLLFRIIEETKPQERIEVSDQTGADNETVAEIRVNESQEDYIEIDDEFDFEGFQVVRREFFAHLTDHVFAHNGADCSKVVGRLDLEFVGVLFLCAIEALDQIGIAGVDVYDVFCFIPQDDCFSF